MGKYWDKLFHDKKYQEIIDTYNQINKDYRDGLRLFLQKNKQYDSVTPDYELKKVYWQNIGSIMSLQKQYEEEQAIARQALKIINGNPNGYSYYSYKNGLSRTLKINEYRAILRDTNIINTYDKEIDNVKQLIKESPEGCELFAKAKGVSPTVLSTPYNGNSIFYIDVLKNASKIVNKYQSFFDLQTNYPQGFKLVIPVITLTEKITETQVDNILSKSDKIKQINDRYEDFLKMYESDPYIVELYIKQKWPDYKFDRNNLSLEIIQSISWFYSYSEETIEMGPVDRSIVKSLSSFSVSQRNLYLLRYVTESYKPQIQVTPVESKDSVVPFLLRNYAEIDANGITIKKYYETYQKLLTDSHSITSAASLCKEMKKTVLGFYGKQGSEKIPFAALEDVFFNNILRARIEAQKDLDKVNSILNRYHKGYRALVEKKVIRDYDIDNLINREEIKWVLENELRFREEQNNVERREKEERERREIQARKDEAKQLLSRYSRAAKYLLPSVSQSSISDSEARTVINKESDLKELNRLFDSISDWNTEIGIPHYFFYYYYSKKKYSDYDISSESIYARKMIWDFKNGTSHRTVKDIVEQKLRSTFGSDCNDLTFVCIPASTSYDHKNRYKDFSSEVCSDLHMTNGFDYIRITKDRTPNHMGGTDPAEYEFTTSFFRGKRVVMFDDVVTRGHSMQWFKTTLEGFGAIVICCMSIGRTYSDYYGDNRKSHPWSGIL